MSTTIPTRDERARFLRERQAGVRSSDMPRLLGLYGSPTEVYYEKTRPLELDDQIGGLALPLNLLRGIMREREIVELYVAFQESRGVEVTVETIGVASKTDPECEWLGTHVDRIVRRADGDRFPLEAKAPSVPVYRRLAERGFSVSYYVQLQVHIACWDADHGDFAASNLEPHGLPPIVSHGRARDDDVIRVLRQVAEHFMTEHVARLIPPERDAYSKYLATLDIPEPPKLEGELLVEGANDGVRATFRRLLEARRHAKLAKEIEDHSREEIQATLVEAGAETFRAPGLGYAHWRPQTRKGNLDVELLEAHRPIDRDALIRALGTIGGETSDALEVAGVTRSAVDVVVALIHDAAQAGDLDLDIETFRKPGSESRPFRIYPEKEEETS